MAFSLTACGLAENKFADKRNTSQIAGTLDEETASQQSITGEITVLTNRTDLVDNRFEEYKEDFESRYPGTKVTFKAFEDYEGEAAKLIASGDYGDVLLIPGAIANKDYDTYFEPLGTIESLSCDYDKEYLYAAAIGEDVYGLASGVNMQGIVYNKRIFDEAGIEEIPKTPEDFLEGLKLIKENTSAIPCYTNYAAGWTLTAWQDYCWGGATGDASYHQNGMVEDDKPFSKGKPNYEVHKILYDIVNEGLCEEDIENTDWEASKGMLNRGEIGCMVLGSWAYGQIQAADSHPEDVGYMAFPISKGDRQYATAATDYCYAVSRNSKNKETAKAWITYMLQDTGFAISEGSVSIYRLDPNPGTVADFYGVELIMDSGATPENSGRFETVNQNSGINLTSEDSKKQIVAAALADEESFDDVMNDWNEKWSKALSECKAQ